MAIWKLVNFICQYYLKIEVKKPLFIVQFTLLLAAGMAFPCWPPGKAGHQGSLFRPPSGSVSMLLPSLSSWKSGHGRHIIWAMTVLILCKLFLWRSSQSRRQNGNGNSFRIFMTGDLYVAVSYIQTAAQCLSTKIKLASCWPSAYSGNLDLRSPVSSGTSPSVIFLCQLQVFSLPLTCGCCSALSYGCSNSMVSPWKYHSVSEFLLSSLGWNMLPYFHLISIPVCLPICPFSHMLSCFCSGTTFYSFEPSATSANRLFYFSVTVYSLNSNPSYFWSAILDQCLFNEGMAKTHLEGMRNVGSWAQPREILIQHRE